MINKLRFVLVADKLASWLLDKKVTSFVEGQWHATWKNIYKLMCRITNTVHCTSDVFVIEALFAGCFLDNTYPYDYPEKRASQKLPHITRLLKSNRIIVHKSMLDKILQHGKTSNFFVWDLLNDESNHLCRILQLIQYRF